MIPRHVFSSLFLTILLLMLPSTLPAAPPEVPVTSPKTILLDDFENLSGWSAAVSSGARLEIAQDMGLDGRRAMRLDFEFQEGASFVIARKTFRMRLPENFVFRYAMRGQGPRSDMEFKLIDARQNVWWAKQRDLDFPADWQPVTVKKRHLQLAWGPGGAVEPLTEIEFAISASVLGKGSVWIDNLTLEEREPLETATFNPLATASTEVHGHPPAAALNTDANTSWRSGELAEKQWLLLDFVRPREYGGLILDWDADDYAIDYQVQASDDGERWRTLYTVNGGNGQRDYLYLYDAESRYLRLNLERSSRGRGYAIRYVAIQSYEFSASPNRFFETVARDARRGLYPRYLQGEQSYWTVVGVPGDSQEALLNEDGAVEVGKGGFTVEPFLFTNGQLITWADVEPVQSLAEGHLPIPTVRWELEHFWFAVTAFAAGKAGESALYTRYRIENLSDETRHIALFLTVRPFQVSPPWQGLNSATGVAPIRQLNYANRRLHVEPAGKKIAVLTTPDRFRAAAFDQGALTDDLINGRLPQRELVEQDTFGYAAGVLEYGWDLRPGEARDVYLRTPFHAVGNDAPILPEADAAAQVNRLLEKTQREWAARLDRASLELPQEARHLADSLKSNLAYILINRNGPAIQPGSRAYARSWIRDGALTSSALLSMGFTEEARQFLQWFAPHQFPDGKVPCCVDGRGADPTVEHDSHGQLIYAAMEYYRYTRDVGFLREMWPYVVKAVGYIETLRQQRSTGKYADDAKYQAYRGLVPESISHEGYASQPQHSYWDNFFILRGLKDAAAMAVILDEAPEIARMTVLRDAFAQDLYASIAETLKVHQIDFIPGAVELGDFDPTSTTVALDPGGELGRLPQPALNRTFDRYLDFFRERQAKATWEAYTPYEWRSVGALIRLGRRDEALEAMAFFLEGQRPRAWNHWAEVVWRNPRMPRFIGDMPHTWVSSDFIRAVRSLFVYEEEATQALVIGAGLPAAWVESREGVAIKRMPTWHGTLNYQMAMAGPNTLRVRLSGDVAVPAGGILLHSPLDRPVREVVINGQSATALTAKTVRVDRFPAEVELRY
ncbi:MAG: hypothetical protein QG599_1150 [Pseudomonadota bacterium]|nr:hypothetical protein [Pseudomonadota bacterium]